MCQCGWSHLGKYYCASSWANHKLYLHLNLLWQMSHELSKVSCVLLASASPISASDFAAPASFASTAAIASNVQISPNLEKKDLRCHKTYSIPLHRLYVHLPYLHQVSPASHQPATLQLGWTQAQGLLRLCRKGPSKNRSRQLYLLCALYLSLWSHCLTSYKCNWISLGMFSPKIQLGMYYASYTYVSAD